MVPLKMGKRDSFLLADDVSLLLGSQSSLDGGEQFHSPIRHLPFYASCAACFFMQRACHVLLSHLFNLTNAGSLSVYLIH